MNAESETYALAMNFGWVETARLAGCRGPRSRKDLAFLFNSGIRALVRLGYEEETGISSSDVKESGMEDCYEPVPDFKPPSQSQIDHVLGFIWRRIGHGKPVAVSCGAGYGRTGTVLACYIVSCGHTADQAIEWLISRRPCSDEILRVPGQKDAVVEFARRLRSGETAVQTEPKE